jgi:hypothetical protein
MSGQLVIDKAASVEPAEPGGLAIFCFIVGAPHIYGRIQSHQCHPQPHRLALRSGKFPILTALAGILVAASLFVILQ